MGLRLPEGLVEALTWVGCTWPEADETRLYEVGNSWLAFAGEAEVHTEAAVTAVDVMVRENSSPGITAFVTYWEKVAGEDGYLADSRIVAGAIAIAFFAASGLVLALKLIVIAQLVAFAILLTAALAAAFFTLGASVAAATAVAVRVGLQINQAVRMTVELIDELGHEVAKLAHEHLNKEIQRLDGRPIHHSPSRVDSFLTPEQREAARKEYEKRMEGLAMDPSNRPKDPDRKTEISEKTLREAEVALALEAMGRVPPPVERAEDPSADFVDGSKKNWDVKQFGTYPGKRGTYTRQGAIDAITKEIKGNENVVLDVSMLSPGDLKDLKDLVASRLDWDGKVVIY